MKKYRIRHEVRRGNSTYYIEQYVRGILSPIWALETDEGGIPYSFPTLKEAKEWIEKTKPKYNRTEYIEV